MVGCDAAIVAVVAEDVGTIVSIFLWHGLFLDVSVQSPELTFHVGYALRTDRAFVARDTPLCEAGLVNAVSALHERHGSVRSEHVLPTDRTIALGASLDAFMSFLGLDRHACSASLAVEEIFAESFSQSTDTTVDTVVY